MIDLTLSAPSFWMLLIMLPIKIWAAWEAAQREQFGWFVLFFLTWLYAIPEIVYLVWFRKSAWR